MAASTDGRRPPQAEGPDRFIRHATLRQLQLLEAIVRLGSFTRAAEELFLTQPTVSMQIKKLAEAAGVPLFQQVGRNVEPTDAGREVYAASRTILRTLSELEIRLADLQGLRRGRLRLGVVTTAKYFAPELLGAFCARWPGIDVALKVSNRERILERLADSEDDLYIVGHPGEGVTNIEALPFAPNPLVLVAPSDHPLAGEQDIPCARIAEECFILREAGSGIREAVQKWFTGHGQRPSVRMELGSNEAIKHAVLGGLGISVLSLHSLTLDAPGGRLTCLQAEDFPLERTWYLAYSKSRDLSLVARTFLAFAIDHEREIRAVLDATLTALQRAGAR
jgi:DNA-binding transcriptional LysR family regulator